MKKFNYLLLPLLCLSLTIFTACNNDDDDDGIGVGGGCTASWTVDGTDYTIDDLALCVYLDNTMSLNASAGGGDFQLQIDPITAPGTYTVDPSNSDVFVVITLLLDDGTKIGIINGEIIVTEISSSKARGTFSGDFFDLTDITLTPSFSVTNGTFEANF